MCSFFSLRKKKGISLIIFTTKNIVHLSVEHLLTLMTMKSWSINIVSSGNFILSVVSGIDTLQITVKLTHLSQKLFFT